MADRSSAWIYGRVFEMIVRAVEPKRQKAEARRAWKDMQEFDFAPDDMHAEKALLKLGLAKKKVDPQFPEDGPMIVYYGEDLW